MEGYNEIEITLSEQLSFRSHYQKLHHIKNKGFPIVGYVNLRPDPNCEWSERHCEKTGSTFIKFRMKE